MKEIEQRREEAGGGGRGEVAVTQKVRLVEMAKRPSPGHVAWRRVSLDRRRRGIASYRQDSPSQLRLLSLDIDRGEYLLMVCNCPASRAFCGVTT